MGLTQAQLAKELQTTQQTIARWESGQTEVPVAALRDLATLFGCSVDELLGVERPSARRLRTIKRTARARHAPPFGTLSLGFAFGQRDYPIDEDVRDRLREMVGELTSNTSWLSFVSLDNRVVFVNPAAIEEAALVSDDAEGMPHFASPETYRSFTTQNDKDIGPLVEKERQQLMRQMASTTTDLAAATEAVHEALTSMRYTFLTGREVTRYFSEDAASNLLLLEDRAPQIGPNALLVVDAEGHEVQRSVNLSALAVIEAPLQQYLDYLATDE